MGVEGSRGKRRGGGMTVARGSRQRELASYLLVCLSMICLLMLQLSEERRRERARGGFGAG